MTTSRVTSLARSHMRRRGFLFLAVGVTVITGLIFGILSLQSTPAVCHNIVVFD